MLDAAVADSVAYLGSAAARASLAADPYWPKWHSPWWHVLSLYEAGAPVPREAVIALARASEAHYLTFFPRAPEVLPAGKSPRTDVMCFCALASLLKVAHGIASISWADDFLLRYQLPDGGWNCDEHSAVSSMVSTVPVLEYLLLRPELRARLDRGVEYVLARRLCRSKRTGAVLDPAWLHPTFPRFYEYDVLRGLELLVAWGGPLPRDVVDEALRCEAEAPRCWPLDMVREKSNGAETTFPLLEALGQPALVREKISGRWQRVRAALG